MVSLSKGFEQCRQFLGGVRGYSPATLANYERTWGQFLAYLKGRGAHDEARAFTTEAVMGFCSDLAARGAVGNTILNKLHALSTLARFLMKQTDGRGRAKLAANPTLGFERPRETKPETKFLHPDELAVLMAAPCSPSLAMARALLLDTGIRCLEACEANLDDLIQIGTEWHLSLNVKGRRHIGEEPAKVPVSPDVAEALARWRNEGVPATRARTNEGVPVPLLVNSRGERFSRSQLTQSMIALGRRAGIRRLTTSPHKLRHTTNVVARMAGIDPVIRAAMLNHRGMKTLARYDHLVPGEVSKGREQQRRGFEQYLRLSTISSVGKPVISQATDEGNP
jgi:site-specific recombinase XerD